jgi:hypothetical protein
MSVANMKMNLIVSVISESPRNEKPEYLSDQSQVSGCFCDRYGCGGSFPKVEESCRVAVPEFALEAYSLILI